MAESGQRIDFGDAETQNMPVEWAESMLRELFKTRRKQFGDLLRAVILAMPE